MKSAKVPVAPVPVNDVIKSKSPSPPIVSFVIFSVARALLVNVHVVVIPAVTVIPVKPLPDGVPLSHTTPSNSNPSDAATPRSSSIS